MTTCVPKKEWEEKDEEERANLLARQGQGYVTADLVRVVDENMNDVPLDGETMGEIVMHGNMVAKGYFENEEETEEAFEGGWYHSGDMAVWHPDGYADIRDRDKDVIISGGENISTIEVEQTVMKHPAVMEAAVVAIPSEKWGERPKAFVTLKQGEEATEEEIIDFCKERIARFKAPEAVDFGDLPKTATGKVQKFVLRDQEWEGQEKESPLATSSRRRSAWHDYTSSKYSSATKVSAATRSAYSSKEVKSQRKTRQKIVATDLGFSETVFVDDPETGELRIFTPTTELPFAGHPLVGTAWLLSKGA